MSLLVGHEPPFAVFGSVLNAICERLVVSTMHNGHRYRVVFSKGMLVTLLGRAHCDRPLGVTWLTFRPDASIIAKQALTLGQVQEMAERNAEGVRIRIQDRTTEDTDWY
jgi:DNA gyrase/topoisomerase IV subunit B